MSSGKRICLFGGTFDPIHNAHLQIASEAQKRFGLDQVLFVPAANPPHKDGVHLTPFEDRLLMVQLACEPYPEFSASRLEEGEERSYTVDTLERFRPRLKPDDELFFLIGADAFDDLKTWKRWQDVLKLTRFIVVSRPGRTYQIPDGASVLRLDDLQLPVASTTIRSRLQAGQPTPELPVAVRQFIDTHGLYKAESKFYCEAQK
jgi:nicotinate-nucleotide adenylyltransferase